MTGQKVQATVIRESRLTSRIDEEDFDTVFFL
jgi:hypothetical protein